MTPDHLLLWLSAKGQGSWPQFRSAMEKLQVGHTDAGAAIGDQADEEAPTGAATDLPLYQQIRFALQRLGHVEFFVDEIENGWRVVAPVIALYADASPQEGLLCGARSTSLLDGLWSLRDINVQVSPNDGGPDRILLRGPSRAVLSDQVRALGIRVQRWAALSILSVLPRTRDINTWKIQPMPETPGWTIHRFSTSRHQWNEVSLTSATNAPIGLFRFRMKHERRHYLRYQAHTYSVPVQIGKYFVMRKRRGILVYDRAQRLLSVPAVFRPPLLIERAAILCSGFLPRFDPQSYRLVYRDVPPDIARLAAQLLHQETT